MNEIGVPAYHFSQAFSEPHPDVFKSVRRHLLNLAHFGAVSLRVSVKSTDHWTLSNENTLLKIFVDWCKLGNTL